MKNVLIVFHLSCLLFFAHHNVVFENIISNPANEFQKEDLKKGIFIMTKKGCPRCKETLLYLNNNKIAFKELKYDNTADRAKVWTLLKQEKNLPKNITFPIVVINGKLTHSHDNLTQFLKTIK
ncbi:MAG: glutaredoxin domain-containing protein [Flavobacterium sp.]|jgi:glutaredoxin|uniref:glutaredoxin domain-containing protein n=1 Tax=Flavobacterium sp. TaxID=239 RepID=UPI0037A3C8A8